MDMKTMPNAPQVKLAIVAVSRDCFPIELSRKRSRELVKACRAAGLKVYPCPTIIENESDALQAVLKCRENGANAAVVYLGNFGPEGPLSIFAEHFGGPVMLCGAAEESKDTLVGGRGDAFCGMLSASYNFDLRDIPALLTRLRIDHRVSPVTQFQGGYTHAKRRLDEFIADHLNDYKSARAHPGEPAISFLSPYLHFGQISPVEIALAVSQAKASDESRSSYLEELLVTVDA